MMAAPAAERPECELATEPESRRSATIRKGVAHARTFAGALLPTVAALAVQLVAFAIVARGLGVEAFGAYTAAVALAVIGVECVGLGGGDLLVRGTARDAARFRFYYGNMLLLAGATFPLVVGGGTWIAYSFMDTRLSLASIVLVLAGEIAVGRAASSLELVMVAHRHTVRAGWLRLTTASLRLALAGAFFILLGQSKLDTWIMAASVQAALTAFGYILLGARLYGRPLPTLLSSELPAGATFCLNQISRASQGNIDRIVLSRFAEAATVGVYGAASRVLALGLFPLQVVTRMTYANYFLHGRNGMKASRRYALRVSPVMLATGLAASGAVALAGACAPWILGEDFAGMSRLAALLSLALPLIALQYPAADALTGAGRQGVRAMISVAAAIGFGFIMALGARIGGSDGLAAAFVIGHGVFAAALWTAACLAKDPGEPADERPEAMPEPSPSLSSGSPKQK
jgi:O-antigen/teichoic acid export membrane protein